MAIKGVIARVRDAPLPIRIVAVIVTTLSGWWTNIKWALDHVSRVETGGHVIATLSKPHGIERLIEATPIWIPLGTLVVSALFIVAYLLVPTAWWKKPQEAALDESRRRPKREPTDPLRAELMEISGKYADAYRDLEDCNRELAAVKKAGEKLTRERDDALRKLEKYHAEPPVAPKPAESLLAGYVERFDSLERTAYTSEQYGRDLRQRLGREPTGRESLSDALSPRRDPEYVAWLKVQTTGTATKALDWSATVSHKDGGEIACELLPKEWEAPKTWTQGVKFYNIVEMQSIILENNHMYNVLLHVVCGASEGQLNMRSRRVRLRDDKGTFTICSMQKPSAAL